MNPSYPDTYSTSSGTCTYTLSKSTSDICMLRLDFIDGTVGNPSEDGGCDSSYFTSNPVTGPDMPKICGSNNGQHIYLDAGAYSSSSTTFSVVVGASGLDWKVLVTQIECSSASLPWPGCLQYFTGVEVQGIKTFNYDVGLKYESLADQQYQICVRRELGFCSIGWINSPTETDSFKISKPATNYAAAVGTSCYADFILIPEGSNGGRGSCNCGPGTSNTHPSCDNYCGGSLNCNLNAVVGSNSEIISKVLPFGLGVSLNAQDPDAADNRGFNMIYRQYGC